MEGRLTLQSDRAGGLFGEQFSMALSDVALTMRNNGVGWDWERCDLIRINFD
jgi:hypothetical protein